MMALMLGIDTGGTFTDAVLVDDGSVLDTDDVLPGNSHHRQQALMCLHRMIESDRQHRCVGFGRVFSHGVTIEPGNAIGASHRRSGTEPRTARAHRK